MTDIVEALEAAKAYMAKSSQYDASTLNEYIEAAKAETELGNLDSVKRAFDLAQEEVRWFSSGFDNSSPGFKRWFKTFFEAAREGSTRPLLVGDLVKITGPLQTTNGSGVNYFSQGDIAKVTDEIDEDGDVKITHPTRRYSSQYIDAKSLTLAEDTSPRSWTNPEDIPADVTLIRDCDGDTWGRGGGVDEWDSTMRDWPTSSTYAPFTEVIK